MAHSRSSLCDSGERGNGIATNLIVFLAAPFDGPIQALIGTDADAMTNLYVLWVR